MDRNNHPDLIEKKYEFNITKGQKSERLDVFLTRSIHNATRNKVQQAIIAKQVIVNGYTNKKVSYKIMPNDNIVCIVMQLPPIELVPENIPLNVIYEDDYLLVLNKPPFMCVHPGVGNRYGTLINGLLYYFGYRDNIEFNIDVDDDDAESYNYQILQASTTRPGLVHRIDKDTSGLLVVAKDLFVHSQLSLQFANKTTQREYIAIVWGKPKQNSGTIETNIGRSPKDRTSFVVLENSGKKAITTYKVIEYFDYAAMIQFKLKTGRTHQIRVHSAYIGNKLIGDVRYGGNKILSGLENKSWKQYANKLLEFVPRQMLHAKTLGFVHPITKKEMLFDSELPDDMNTCLKMLKEFNKENISKT